MTPEKLIAELRELAAKRAYSAKVLRSPGHDDLHDMLAEAQEQEVALFDQAATTLEGLVGEKRASDAIRNVLSENLERRTLALAAAEARATAAEAQRDGYKYHLDQCEQIAGKALGYPWFKDDQENFPGATEADGVCIGEHVGDSIVEELARRFEELRGEVVEVVGPLLAFAEAAEDKELVGDEGCVWSVELARDLVSRVKGGDISSRDLTSSDDGGDKSSRCSLATGEVKP